MHSTNSVHQPAGDAYRPIFKCPSLKGRFQPEADMVFDLVRHPFSQQVRAETGLSLHWFLFT